MTNNKLGLQVKLKLTDVARTNVFLKTKSRIFLKYKVQVTKR